MFLVAMKFVVTLAIFAYFFRFLQAVFIELVFAKISTIFASKFLLQPAVYVEFVTLAIFATLFYSFLIAVSFKSFSPKFRK